DVFDMVRARQYYNTSKFVTSHGGPASASFTLTIVVPTADPVNLAAARSWGDNLQKLGPTGNIVINTRTMSFHDIIAEMNPHANRMSLWFLGWLPDYPYPTDYTYPMLEPGNNATEYGGTYPAANGLNISYRAPLESNPMLGGTDILYNLLAKSGTIQGAVATSSSAGPGALGGFGITPLIATLGLLAVRRRDEEP